MGQRAQLLVIKKKPNGETEKRLYHNQWGQGRRLFNGLMSIFSSVIDGVEPYDDRIIPTLKDVELKNLPSFSNYYHNEEPATSKHKELEAVDINNFETIKTLYETLDNNDGGLVVQVVWEAKDGWQRDIKDIKAGFLLNCVDAPHAKMDGDGRFAKFISPQRFREVEGGPYVEGAFFESFLSLCKYANVHWLHEE